MNIARIAVSRPVAMTMLVLAPVLLGAVCLTRLPVDLLPKVSLPTISVQTSWPNVAPQEIETQITRPVEEAVSAAPNIYQVNSSTTEGSSSVRVQFQWGTDMGQAAVDVLQLVERAKQRFPNDATLKTPIIRKFDPNQMAILVYGVTGESDPVKLRTILENQVVPMVEAANGVASATVSGGQERAIIIDADPVRLAAHSVTLSQVIKRISQENLNLPAGIGKQGNTEYVIRSLGWLPSPEKLAKLPITSLNGRLVTLGEVADVRDSHDETRVYTRFNGEPSASLSIAKQSEANTISTGYEVKEKIEKVRELYPNLSFSVAYDQASYIEQSINDVKISAFLGGTLAILILLFFLRNLRSTLVVAISIPTAIISTFSLVYLCGFTLNTMSLGGLALATGLIVDDAVVVLENIFRHIERDRKDVWTAAVDATTEIMGAVFASTWTVMVVFLPLVFIKGQAAQMYTQFALVVVFSLAISLVVALTAVPMLATRLISGEAHAENINGEVRHRGLLQLAFRQAGKWFDALDQSYRNGLQWAIHHRLTVLIAAVVITIGSLPIMAQVGTELMPATDSGDFSVSIKMPVGTALEKTNEVVLQVEDIVRANPNIDTVLAAAGANMRSAGSVGQSVPFQGSVTAKLKPDAKATTQEVMRSLRKQLSALPGVSARLEQNDLVSSLMTGGGQNVEIDIFGQDLATLSSTAKEVMAALRDIPGLENLDVNWQEAMPEIQWQVNRDKASSLGLSFSDVANTINTATNGSIASYYQESGFQYPIIVQVPEGKRKTVEDMLHLVVSPSSGNNTQGAITLNQVAHANYGTGPSQITRLNRQRYIAVTGSPQGRSPGEVQTDIKKALSRVTLPTGYYWDWGTSQKRRGEEFAGMALAVILAIGLIYMLLASQFEAFLHPFTILLTVPLAATGVALGLFLTGRSFGITAFIGTLMLVGIVVKNGILLVDYTNHLRSQGMGRDEALLRAGPTRLRPILMTASAAILGMLPIALGLGKGSEVQAPMATAVIGGLATSTLLTLFVVPVVYSALDGLTNYIARKLKG
ncbi:efflux RND transporter permease subunit [bacterium]|nr:efflux RND transporter permease subunit [bacterium]